MWLTAIPIVGKIIEKIIDFCANRWGYNPKEQERKEMAQEIMRESAILDYFKELADMILAREGSAADLIKMGWSGKLLMTLRASWRPVLQWGMTLKVMYSMFIEGRSLEEMQTAIAFVAGLALMREVGKKFQTKEGK